MSHSGGAWRMVRHNTVSTIYYRLPHRHSVSTREGTPLMNDPDGGGVRWGLRYHLHDQCCPLAVSEATCREATSCIILTQNEKNLCGAARCAIPVAHDGI